MMTKRYKYWLSGLGLEVDQVLPTLSPLHDETAPNVTIRVREVWGQPAECHEYAPWFSSQTRADSGGPQLSITKSHRGDYCMSFSDGPNAFFDSTADNVLIDVPACTSGYEIVEYLQGPVVCFLWLLRGVPCLHASAVAVDEGAVVFVGPSHAGKSTIAAGLARRGYAVIADDLVPIGEWKSAGVGFRVFPSCTTLRLRAPTLDLLGLTTHPGLRPAGDGATYDLVMPCAGLRFQSEPLPLAVVYLCDPSPDAADDTPIEDVSAIDGLLGIMANTWAGCVLDGPMWAQQMEYLARVVADVPVRRVHRSASTPLNDLTEVIMRDIAALPRNWVA